MASFKDASVTCSEDFLTSMSVSAEQIDAVVRVSRAARSKNGAMAKDLGTGRRRPVCKNDPELARRVNDFLLEDGR